MAYTHFVDGEHAAPSHQIERFSGLAGRLWRAYRGWRARRETLRMLHALDAGTLRDLGISPREIESLVYGTPGDRTRSYDENWWQQRKS